MPICIYCRDPKQESEVSLEHIIPQALGGKFAPPAFAIKDVCRKCNNNLGQYVDASFCRSWFIDSWLKLTKMDSFDSDKKIGVDLSCMGVLDLKLPGMSDDEVVEQYVGPFSEAVYWVRKKDDKFYWLNGGNPRDAKEHETRAYFYLSRRSHIEYNIPLHTFREAFKGKKVRKVFGTNVQIDLKSLRFKEPDDLDKQRIAALWLHAERGNVRAALRINVNFDTRFMFKLARGVSYCLLGEGVLHGAYADEIQKGIWLSDVDDMPNVTGIGMAATFGKNEPNILGLEQAITVTAMPMPRGLSVTLSIGATHHATILAASREQMSDMDYAKLGHGQMIVLYPGLGKSIQLTLPEFINHRCGRPQTGLAEIEAELLRRGRYFAEQAAKERQKRTASENSGEN